METWQQTRPEQLDPLGKETEEQPLQGWSAQDRLRPTPDYGTLGPGSDIAVRRSGWSSQDLTLRKATLAAAIVAAVFIWVLVGNVDSARAAWDRLGDLFAPAQNSGKSAGVSSLASAKNINQLNRLKPQKQAENLLELAIGNSGGANQEIAHRVDGWRGKLNLDSQLGTLTTAALNSNDLRVRQSGLEVQLAAYGLAKNASTVDFLIQSAESSSHAQKIWALWALGALANRGIETTRVEQALVSHLKDADEDSRGWAVEGLALVGTGTTIPPLLNAMHNDPSPAVRERAACSLAEAGMLSHEQRLTAVPQLVNYTEDSSLDSQTHAWAFQALGDITKERLPNDPRAWRNWYALAKDE
ncbi:MAG TPA: HEAT repeat domain-containing protein [Candidatus Sulfotelmatobacter sp.]